MDSSNHNESGESTPVPDTSHLTGSGMHPKNPWKKRLYSILIASIVLALIAAVGGGLYYLKAQNDKKSAEAAATARQIAGKQQTPEQQLTAKLADSLQEQLDTLQLDNGNVAIANSTESAEQVGKNLGASSAQLNKCTAVSAFATKSALTLKTDQQNLAATFAQALATMATAWKQEDQANTSLRQDSENAFTTQADDFARTPGLSSAQKSAVTDYQTTLVTESHTHETNIDAAEAAYRQDIETLVKSHQAALTALAQLSVLAIDNALATAEQNCTQSGAATTLAGAITSANQELLEKANTLDSQSVAKATTIVATRNSALKQENTGFMTTSDQATTTLTNVILNGK
jgi:hypothetical protein